MSFVDCLTSKALIFFIKAFRNSRSLLVSNQTQLTQFHVEYFSPFRFILAFQTVFTRNLF